VDRKLLRPGVACAHLVSCVWRWWPLTMCVDVRAFRCERHVVACRHCGDGYLRLDLPKHESSECLDRPTPCEHCRTIVPFKALSKHVSENCGDLKVECDKHRAPGAHAWVGAP